MTTQYAVFSGLPTGLTLTKKVFTEADPDVEVTGITGAVTERTNAKGQYTVAVTKAAVITGVHTTILFVGSTPVAIGKRTFAGTDGETASELGVELDSPTITSIQSGLSTQASVDAVSTQLVDILSLVESISLTGAASYQAAVSSTLTTGNLSSGTYENTASADGVSHVHTDQAGTLLVDYDFEMGAAEVGVEVHFSGRVNSANDSVAVQVYDWIGADWETLWTQVGVGGSVNTDRAEPLLLKHTGTGANDGNVRIRFSGTGLSSATLYVDQLLVAKTVTQVDLTPAAIALVQSGLATPADVNAQVLDVLSVDAFAELTAPPAATSSLKDKLTWLFMYARNKVTQTTLERTLYRDDTTTVAGTSATSDNGTTFTKGEDS